MTAHETVLLTGITGSIGSWVAGAILEDGGQIVAIVRADTSSAAAARVREALAVVGAQEYADRVKVACGDICDDGLMGRLIQTGMKISHIVHCAGVVEFGQEFAALSHRVNVRDW
jgi:thioester reductase-like protein